MSYKLAMANWRMGNPDDLVYFLKLDFSVRSVVSGDESLDKNSLTGTGLSAQAGKMHPHIIKKIDLLHILERTEIDCSGIPNFPIKPGETIEIYLTSPSSPAIALVHENSYPFVNEDYGKYQAAVNQLKNPETSEENCAPA